MVDAQVARDGRGIDMRRAGVRNAVVVGAVVLSGLLAGETGAAFRNPDGVAVIIGNRAYKYDVPQVTYAHRDAEAFRRYVVDVLGFDPENVIHQKDADKATMERVFGNRDSLTGSELWRHLHPDGFSDVVVFYSGHGIPGLNDKRGYLLPVNAHPDTAELNGYPIDVLYENLVKLKEQQAVRSVHVFLDACFSGDSGGGRLIGSTSAIRVAPRIESAGLGKLTILTAASGKEVASWDKAAKHGLFTQHLLNALYGEGDADADGQVTAVEAKAYLDRHMTRAARRIFGRVQNADLRGVETAVLARSLGGMFPVRPLIGPARQVGERFRDCPTCPEMVVVPAGNYQMGSVDGASFPSNSSRSSDSHPVHRVTIADPFAVGVYEVTRGEFRRFVEATEYSTGGACEWRERRDRSWRNPGFAQTDQHPVVCMSWADAQAYVEWLSQETGEAYRLLSEAEWEYVARAGTRTARYWGQGKSEQCLYANGADTALLRSDERRKQFNDETAKEQAKTLAAYEGYLSEMQAVECDDGYAWTSPVGVYGANAFGLHDVLGNVGEWVQDCWHASYHGAPRSGDAWESADCSEFVKRTRVFEWKRKDLERIELENKRKGDECGAGSADDYPDCIVRALRHYIGHFFKQNAVVLRRVARGGSWSGDALSIRSDVRGATITHEYSDIGFPVTKEQFLRDYYATFHHKFTHLEFDQFADFVEQDFRKDPTVFGQMAEEMEVSKLTATPKFKREYYDAYQDKFQDIPFEQFEGLVENRILQDPKFLKQMGDDLYNFYRHKMSRAEFDAEFLGSIDKSDPTLLKLRSRAEGLVQTAKIADVPIPQTSERNRASTPVWTITKQDSSYTGVGFRVARTLD